MTRWRRLARNIWPALARIGSETLPLAARGVSAALAVAPALWRAAKTPPADLLRQ